MRRVVITGLGAISPHGLGSNLLWSGLLEGLSSLAPLTRFDPTAFDCHVAGCIPAYKPTEYVPKSYRKATKIMARDIELAVVAADFAVRDAKILTRGMLETLGADGAKTAGFNAVDPARLGCNIGAGLICADLDELAQALSQAANHDANGDASLSLAKWGRSEDPGKASGMEYLTPLWLLKYLPNMLACHVSIIHDTQGPSNTITCGQASAGLAVGEAYRTIQRGAADLALVGGCESKVHPMALMRWSLLGRLNTTSNANPAAACRPMDHAAAGTILAEGGGVLVIEELEHALKRGATIYAEVIGVGASASACPVIQPDASGEAVSVAIRKSLKDARITPEAVSMVIPPGSGVPAFDQADANALALAFGSRLKNLPVLPARGGIGDCGAGAQALDLVAAALALSHQELFPAVNVTDPIGGLAIQRQRQAADLDYALVVGSSLGGQNAAVVLKRPGKY